MWQGGLVDLAGSSALLIPKSPVRKHWAFLLPVVNLISARMLVGVAQQKVLAQGV
jgi:hypothetical protein